MNMSFNGLMFHELSQRLTLLGEQFTIRSTSKDPIIRTMKQEAQIYLFVICHTMFADLLESIYERSFTEKMKKESADSDVPGAVLTLMYREGLVSQEQIVQFAEQYKSAQILSLDGTCFLKPDEKKFFQERTTKISRHYYTMSTFVADFSKGVSFN